jgi:hypothetical protein
MTPVAQPHSFLPPDVIALVKNAFSRANERVTKQVSQIPFTTEPTLDQMLISALSEFNAPIRLPTSGWTVQIDTHFLGGRAMFHRWEVADIGLMVIFRHQSKTVRSKVALLQSKRLYPDSQTQPDMLDSEYAIGFGRLYASDEEYAEFSQQRVFQFGPDSVYREIQKIDGKGEQWETIREYQQQRGIPVHYLLYHPAELPWSVSVPLAAPLGDSWSRTVGARVVSYNHVVTACRRLHAGGHPTFGMLRNAPESDSQAPGRSLEDFVAGRLISCFEGYIAKPRNDPGLYNLFFNRSGPISAAIAITIDAPNGIDFGTRELPE